MRNEMWEQVQSKSRLGTCGGVDIMDGYNVFPNRNCLTEGTGVASVLQTPPRNHHLARLAIRRFRPPLPRLGDRTDW